MSDSALLPPSVPPPSSSSFSSLPSLASLDDRLQSTHGRLSQLLEELAGRNGVATNPQHVAAESIQAQVSPAENNTTTNNTSLLSTCRPFDRFAFLAFVSTYTPLVWSHKESPLLSPLACARQGWICSTSIAERDILQCRLCKNRIALYFSREVLANSSSMKALSKRYAEMLPHHATDCPWYGGCGFDDQFTRILPSDISRETGVSLAIHQTAVRADTLANLPHLIFAESFLSKWEDEIARILQGDTNQQKVKLDRSTILSLCGWEIRSSVSTASTSSLKYPTCLQCCFGCREVDVQSFVYDANGATQSDRPDDEVQEEERSIFQSPLKRRKLNDPTSSLSEIGPSIRTAPDGFHPIQCHRPFCPLVESIDPLNSASPSEDDPILDWQALVRWWLNRHRTLNQTHFDKSDSVDSESIQIVIDNPITPIKTNPSIAASKENQYKSIVQSVHDLLTSALPKLNG